MKLFYFTRFRSYMPKLQRPLRIFLLSDLHFSNKVSQELLDKTFSFAKSRKPDYILVAGDIVDRQEEVDHKKDKNRLLNFFSSLGSVAPVIMIPGNHDYYRESPDYRPGLFSNRHWIPSEKPALIADFNKLDNVHYLYNQSYEDEQLYVLGLSASPEYYQLDNEEGSSLFHPGFEEKPTLIKEIRSLKSELRENLPAEKLKILLFHSPVYLNDPDVTKYFTEFDYFISGHMHNGCVPPLMNELWKSNKGIIGPGKTLIPDHVRFRIDDQNKSLVLGALTTVQKCAHPISFINGIYPVNVAELRLSNNPAHQKADLAFKYIPFSEVK